MPLAIGTPRQVIDEGRGFESATEGSIVHGRTAAEDGSLVPAEWLKQHAVQ